MSTPLMTPYSASKFALEGFFDGFRQEQVMKNTRVSATLIYYGTLGEFQQERVSFFYTHKSNCCCD